MSTRAPNPSLPLANCRHERFSQNLAAGNTGQRAWQLAASPNDPASLGDAGARSSAHRASKRPEIAARVRYLRQQRANEVDWSERSPSRKHLSDMMERVTTAFVELFRKAEAAGAKASDLTKIKRAIGLHTGRAARISDLRPPPVRKTQKIDLQGPLTRLYVCECHR